MVFPKVPLVNKSHVPMSNGLTGFRKAIGEFNSKNYQNSCHSVVPISAKPDMECQFLQN
mgnify:CR=1 FL=1